VGVVVAGVAIAVVGLSTSREYAAVAISPSTFTWGSVENFSSQEEAKAAAVAECGAFDCELFAWTSDGGCASVAVDDTAKTYAQGLGDSKRQAEKAALANLYSDRARILITACNDL
jgi:hypothetical protein